MISTSMRSQGTDLPSAAGGGGYGSPLLRDPELVADDVRNERVSVMAAREMYGVVLQPGTCEPDREATEVLRSGR